MSLVLSRDAHTPSPSTYTRTIDPATTLDRGPQWLLTNGTGAYAMGTVGAVNAHRYHGLLIATHQPPVRRFAVLNQVAESLVSREDDNDDVLAFATCRFRNAQGDPIYAPDGHLHLQRFEKGASVAWHYAAGPVQFTRQLTLHWKMQAATVAYSVTGLPTPMLLQIRPMFTLRDFHALMMQSDTPPFQVQTHRDGFVVQRGSAAATCLCPDMRFLDAPEWWYGMTYAGDAARGLDDHEDHFVAGRFEAEIPASESVSLAMTVHWGRRPEEDTTPTRRPYHPVPGIPPDDDDAPICHALAEAADDFVVDRNSARGNFTTVIAGYPWFADWGRDTFIALPGLLLCTGRFDEAARTLRVYADAIHQGLIPNRFDDYSDRAAHYNTVDASLWFARAAFAYVAIARDTAAWKTWLRDAVMQIIDAYVKGTPSDVEEADRIVVDEDGLVRAGSERMQWTWMDAARDGVVFTPRHGKAVEINALWCHVLIAAAMWSEGPDRRRLTSLAAKAGAAFAPCFWRRAAGYLADHVWTDATGTVRQSTALRPNQIFAASLEHVPLDLDQRQRVVDTVRCKLLTPFGLRTLSPDDLAYRGQYGTGWFERDAAYHQGTVWPWLIGPYAEAVMRADDFSNTSRRVAREALAPLLRQLQGDGLGQLHEIHDGDTPHRPAGCMAQAWSVAEVLRALLLTRAPCRGADGN